MSASLRAKLERFDPDLPLERAHTIPSCWYHDADIEALERRAVFGASWLCAGRLDQAAPPGSFFTIDLAGEPVLVVRGDDGVLRAFYNVCRHRAACVMNEPQGRATRLRCRYHGWTYDLRGRLRGTPEWEGVADFRRQDEGLAPMAVDTWGPLVWVHMGDNPPPLKDFLAPLPERMASAGLERMHCVERRTYDLACNWKVFVDNYLDGGYHINTVHPGLADVLDYSQYRTEVGDWTAVQSGPLRPARGEALVGNVRAGIASYWWAFPNFMMNHYAGVMDTNVVLPLAPGRCRVLIDLYFSDVEGEQAQRFIADSIAVAHQIQLEDVGVCEQVQRGLASRSYNTGRFSVRREAAGYHFHRLLARQLRGAND
jgi:choline monooxygenase